MDSEYEDDDEEVEEQQHDISFVDRCNLIHVKSTALQALVAAHPLIRRANKERLAIITNYVEDIIDQIEQLQAPPPSNKRGRDDDEEEGGERLFDYLGIDLSDAQKKEAGLKVHKAYIKQYGTSPSKKPVVNNDGKGFRINQYSERECIRVVDPILKEYR